MVRDFCDGFKDLLASKGSYQTLVALLGGTALDIVNISDIARFLCFHLASLK